MIPVNLLYRGQKLVLLKLHAVKNRGKPNTKPPITANNKITPQHSIII